jgi:hypothetical protein
LSHASLRALLLLAALACCAQQAGAQSPQPGQTAGAGRVKEEALRRELLKMLETDQAVREPFTTGKPFTEAEARAQQAADEASTRRLLEIIKQHGFPGPALVGRDGADAALVLVLHSPSLALKQKTLSHLKRAVRRGEATPDKLANLTDIILHDHLHKPQLYGTRFDMVGGKLVLQNVKDPARLDVRRRKLGLPPLADYARELGELYKMPVDITAITAAPRR